MPITKVLSARPYGQIFLLNTCDWFRNSFTFEDVIRLLTILSPEKDRQGSYTFSPSCIWSFRMESSWEADSFRSCCEKDWFVESSLGSRIWQEILFEAERGKLHGVKRAMVILCTSASSVSIPLSCDRASLVNWLRGEEEERRNADASC
jgi:hypothetical protein